MQGDLHSLLGIARIYDQLNDVSQAVSIYRQVLSFDSSNVEAISCLASNYFYTDQPELALRLYRRLLQMGLNAAELWNNLGLCCFHAGQYDMCLVCFERALAQSEDDNSADIWYNVGQLAIGIGDLGLAYQAFKIAVSVDVHHAESFNNLGVLELRKHNPEAARSNFEGAHKLSEFHFEPLFNAVRAAGSAVPYGGWVAVGSAVCGCCAPCAHSLRRIWLELSRRVVGAGVAVVQAGRLPAELRPAEQGDRAVPRAQREPGAPQAAQAALRLALIRRRKARGIMQ